MTMSSRRTLDEYANLRQEGAIRLDRAALAAAHALPVPEREEPTPTIKPVDANARSQNALRPQSFEAVIGQENAKRMMRRVLLAAQGRGVPLDHVLLVGASGTGKSTFSHVIANELGVRCFEAEAPISRDLLMELRTTMESRDILRIEEIHQQAIMERRGRGSATEPEVLYAVMEDRVIPSGAGLLPFPHITIIGTTTDEGMLPDAFINRFPLRPVLEPYTERELAVIAALNGDQLDVNVTAEAALTFARASRGVPRQINNYVRNAAMLTGPGQEVDVDLAHEVLDDLNRTTPDGLTRDMVNMMVFLYTHGRRDRPDGSVTYQASVNTIATAIGKSRDSKAIALRVEPYLIQQGLLQVGHMGRTLTDAGVARARKLATEV